MAQGRETLPRNDQSDEYLELIKVLLRSEPQTQCHLSGDGSCHAIVGDKAYVLILVFICYYYILAIRH